MNIQADRIYMAATELCCDTEDVKRKHQQMKTCLSNGGSLRSCLCAATVERSQSDSMNGQCALLSRITTTCLAPVPRLAAGRLLTLEA